jgi:hypothetical protein
MVLQRGRGRVIEGTAGEKLEFGYFRALHARLRE